MKNTYSKISDEVPLEDALTSNEPQIQVIARAFAAGLPEELSKFFNAEVRRPNADIQAAFLGTLNIVLQCHASFWGAVFNGNNPDFLEAEVHSSVDKVWKISFTENAGHRVSKN